MAFTYDELKQALQDYSENDETSFVNNLPLFIRLTEERILKSVQLTLFRKNVAGVMTSGNQYLSSPTDFLAPFSLSYTDGNSDANYASFDVDNFIIGPTPNSNYVVDLHYFYRPVSITAGAGSGTTWLSENAEIALLYGSLIECGTYMKGEQDTMGMYQSRFQEAMGRLKNMGEAQEVTDQYRTGQIVRIKS